MFQSLKYLTAPNLTFYEDDSYLDMIVEHCGTRVTELHTDDYTIAAINRAILACPKVTKLACMVHDELDYRVWGKRITTLKVGVDEMEDLPLIRGVYEYCTNLQDLEICIDDELTSTELLLRIIEGCKELRVFKITAQRASNIGMDKFLSEMRESYPQVCITLWPELSNMDIDDIDVDMDVSYQSGF